MQKMNSNVDVYMVRKRSMMFAIAKLKAASRTSALMSGFAMVIIVELDLSSVQPYNTPPVGNSTATVISRAQYFQIPEGLLVAFFVCASLLVSFHTLALLISTCILPHLEASQDLSQSPHVAMSWYINVAWVCSNVAGMLLFVATMLLLCWVKVYPVTQVGAYASCAAIVPTVILLVAFGVHFYKRLANFKYETTRMDVEELANMVHALRTDDNDSSPKLARARDMQAVLTV